MDKKKEVERGLCAGAVMLDDDDLEVMYRDYQARAKKKEEKNASVV